MIGKNVELEAEQLIRAGATEQRGESSRTKGVTWEAKRTLLLIKNTKQTIKGILGSFTLIDQH